MSESGTLVLADERPDVNKVATLLWEFGKTVRSGEYQEDSIRENGSKPPFPNFEIRTPRKPIRCDGCIARCLCGNALKFLQSVIVPDGRLHIATRSSNHFGDIQVSVQIKPDIVRSEKISRRAWVVSTTPAS